MMYKSPTDVCITVDVEFSIGGAFRDPVRNRPISVQAAECRIAGREHGLGFILDTLGENALPATFFVEALNTAYFGLEPMGDIARRIAQAGHDVQLHLHPCWQYFQQPDWRQRLAMAPPNDDFPGRDRDEVAALIREGLATFTAWGLPRPIALRTGGLRVDRQVYDVMGDFGLPLSSSIGIGIYSPAEPALRLMGGRHRIGRVLELPVLSYVTRLRGGRRPRCLTIMASSTREMEALLWQARRHRVSPVVVLVHPFDFIKQRGVDYHTLTPNDVTKERLIGLCRFLRQHPDDFNAVSFRGRAERWLASSASPNARLGVPLAAEARRLIENKLNELLWW